MARIRVVVGYGTAGELVDGVWSDSIHEVSYFGELTRISINRQNGSEFTPDLTSGNSISIVADEYARGHFSAIRYVKWSGALWSVKEVTSESPRLLLRLGGVYDGPTP